MRQLKTAAQIPHDSLTNVPETTARAEKENSSKVVVQQ